MEKENPLIFIAILLGIFFSLMFSTLPFVAAANISIGNYSNLSSTVSITCGFTGEDGIERNVYSASVYYNNSVITVGTTGLPGAGTLLTTITTNDTASNTTFTESSVSLASLTQQRLTYSFWCQAHNQTTFTGNSSSHGNSTAAKNITIDYTAPSKVEIYTAFDNATAKKKTDQLTLNIFVTDALFLSTASACLISVNGSGVTGAKNQTIPLILDSGSTTTGTCNSTVISLTGNADDIYHMEIYVNDTANNVARNNTNTLYLIIDTTNPSASASCSPSSVKQGVTVTCSCSGTDVTSGVSTSSATTTPSTFVALGSYTYTCTVTDNAGNSASGTATYTITGLSSGDRTIITWTTHAITQEQFQAGYTSQIQANKRVRVQVGGQDHHVGVVSVTADEATIEISSEPVQVTLSVGEDAKVDVTDDGFYDIYVLLNDIVDSKADVTIQKIHEEVPEGADGVDTTGEVAGEDGEEEPEARNLTWLWILIAVIILVVIIGGGIAAKKKK